MYFFCSFFCNDNIIDDGVFFVSSGLRSSYFLLRRRNLFIEFLCFSSLSSLSFLHTSQRVYRVINNPSLRIFNQKITTRSSLRMYVVQVKCNLKNYTCVVRCSSFPRFFFIWHMKELLTRNHGKGINLYIFKVYQPLNVHFVQCDGIESNLNYINLSRRCRFVDCEIWSNKVIQFQTLFLLVLLHVTFLILQMDEIAFVDVLSEFEIKEYDEEL